MTKKRNNVINEFFLKNHLIDHYQWFFSDWYDQKMIQFRFFFLEEEEEEKKSLQNSFHFDWIFIRKRNEKNDTALNSLNEIKMKEEETEPKFNGNFLWKTKFNWIEFNERKKMWTKMKWIGMDESYHRPCVFWIIINQNIQKKK